MIKKLLVGQVIVHVGMLLTMQTDIALLGYLIGLLAGGALAIITVLMCEADERRAP